MCQYLIMALAILSCAYASVSSTARSIVASHLRECYTDPTLLDRNNLPPSSVQTLIDIIQKIEDSSNIDLDLQKLSVLLLHRYRQDGIERYPMQCDEKPENPWSRLNFVPTFHSFYRHKLMLTKLIPLNHDQQELSEILPSALKCILHHMLSTTIDDSQKDTCSQEGGSGETIGPILDGVMYTACGATSAGNVIAGIAAGANSRTVSFKELTRGTGSHFSNFHEDVKNIYPTTLAGDLAEAVLIQGVRGNPDISIGNSGNFNTSQSQRFFMLNSRIDVEMTDPEIRGDLDGFILGSRMSSVLQTYTNLKLSQLLDMYYSSKNGVFDSSIRACQRHVLSGSILSDNNLVSQTEVFAAALDGHMFLPGTLTSELSVLTNNAISNLRTYIQENMTDFNCNKAEASTDISLRTNLYIVLDASWPYAVVYPAISHVLNSIEVGKFGSSVTLLNAFDGHIVVNKTFSPADFHSEYTPLKHQSMKKGINLQNTFTNIRTMMQYTLLNETVTSYIGGNSSVLLFLFNTDDLQISEDTDQLAQTLYKTMPDLIILFAISNNQADKLKNLVRDIHNDIHVIPLINTEISVETTMGSLLHRIKLINRRIINPLCGYEFKAGSSGIRQFDAFIEPGYVQFYSVRPNYFYRNNNDSKIIISITDVGSSILTVCYSRTVGQPRRQSTVRNVDDNLVTCEDLASSGNVAISLQDACEGYSSIEACPPMHISVQAVSASTIFRTICTDSHVCRFPYSIRYTVKTEELQCFSSRPNSGVD